MKEYPFFVTHGTTASPPSSASPSQGRSRGLVLQLMGVGPDEIVGSMMFQRMARRLADRGLASLRLDYAGTGDSTGAVSSWSLADLGGETEQARAVLQTARDAIGGGRYAVAGICYGGRIALELIKDKDCVGALCMSPPVIEYGTWTKTRRKVRKWKLVSYIKSNEFLRTVLLRPLRRMVAERKPTERAVQALGELDHARVLYLWSESEVSRDYSRDRAAKRLERLTGVAAGRAPRPPRRPAHADGPAVRLRPPVTRGPGLHPRPRRELARRVLQRRSSRAVGGRKHGPGARRGRRRLSHTGRRGSLAATADPRHRRAPLGDDVGREDARAARRGSATSMSRSARSRRPGITLRALRGLLPVRLRGERGALPSRPRAHAGLPVRRCGAQLHALHGVRDAARSVKDYAAFTLARPRHARPLLKDPIAVFSSEWLASAFDAEVVFLVRHPAAFASSLKRFGWSTASTTTLEQPLLMRDHLAPFEKEIRSSRPQPGDIVSQAILLWRMIYSTGPTFRERHPDWTFVRHEDLSRDPADRVPRDLRPRRGSNSTAGWRGRSKSTAPMRTRRRQRRATP